MASRGPVPSSNKSTSEASDQSAASAAVSAEGLREAVQTRLPTGAVLQRDLPEPGGTVASLEGPRALPTDGGRSGLSPGAEPAPTRASGGEEAEARNSRPAPPNRRVGHRPAR